MSGESGAIGAGAFHPDPFARPERLEPLREIVVTGGVVGNDSTPSSPPTGSTTAATWTSRWVSTPRQPGVSLLRWASAIPSCATGFKGWHARPGKETVTSRLLAQPARSPSGTGRASLEPATVVTPTGSPVDPRPAGPPQSHWAICASGFAAYVTSPPKELTPGA